MKVSVDKEKCIGCGTCVGLAPDYFKFGDDGKAEVIKEEVAPEDEEKIRNVANSCPVGAITVQ